MLTIRRLILSCISPFNPDSLTGTGSKSGTVSGAEKAIGVDPTLISGPAFRKCQHYVSVLSALFAGDVSIISVCWLRRGSEAKAAWGGLRPRCCSDQPGGSCVARQPPRPADEQNPVPGVRSIFMNSACMNSVFVNSIREQYS